MRKIQGKGREREGSGGWEKQGKVPLYCIIILFFNVLRISERAQSGRGRERGKEDQKRALH